MRGNAKCRRLSFEISPQIGGFGWEIPIQVARAMDRSVVKIKSREATDRTVSITFNFDWPDAGGGMSVAEHGGEYSGAEFQWPGDSIGAAGCDGDSTVDTAQTSDTARRTRRRARV